MEGMGKKNLLVVLADHVEKPAVPFVPIPHPSPKHVAGKPSWAGELLDRQ